MSVKTTLIKNTTFNLLGYFYLLVASFFSISIFLNNLGRDLFGVYILLASFVPLASVFDLGVSVSLIRDLANPDFSNQQKIKIWQNGLYVYLIQSGILFAAFFCLLNYLFSTLPIFNYLKSSNNQLFLSLLISITIFINHLNNAFLNIPQALHRFDVYNSKSYLVGSSNTILSALLTYYTKSLVALFLFQLVFNFLSLFYSVSFCKKHFSSEVLKIQKQKNIIKDLLSFGLKNFVGTLAGQIEAQISKFFLGFLSTATAITAFNVPQNIFLKGAAVISQVSQAFFPLSASLLTKDRIKKLKNLYFWLQACIFIGGFIVIYLTFSYGEVFLEWWLKDPIIVGIALPVFRALSFYFVLLSLTPLPTALLQGLGKPQIPSFFAVLTTILEAIFMWILIPKYHELGAAYAYLATITITSPTFLIVTAIVFNNQIKKILLPNDKQAHTNLF